MMSGPSSSTVYVAGSANCDLAFPIERLPRRGETLAAGNVSMHPGGKGANQACAAARLGAATRLIAQLGEDSLAEPLLASLRAARVDLSGVGRAAGATGCAFIGVYTDGENSILISAGANGTLTPSVAQERLRELRPGDTVLLQLEVPMETVEAIAVAARQAGARVILDPAPAQALRAELLAAVDILTPNQSEASLLAGASGATVHTVDEAEAVARQLLERGPELVIVKLGRLGCVAVSRERRLHSSGFPVQAVDTTAAGDVFNGALAVALAEGKELALALQFANAAAALSVTRPGAQSSIPTRAEVDGLLESALLSR